MSRKKKSMISDVSDAAGDILSLLRQRIFLTVFLIGGRLKSKKVIDNNLRNNAHTKRFYSKYA